MYSYGSIEPIFWAIESFPPLLVTLVEHMQMRQCPYCFWCLGHHSVLCWECVHTSLGAHIHSVSKFMIFYNISMWYNSIKTMLICGLHWHSRYSIVDFYIFLMHFRVVYRDFLWPTSTKCVIFDVIGSFYHLLIVQHIFPCTFTDFVICDTHKWNGFDLFSQSWKWHWCMLSLHMEWYLCTNDSILSFYYCRFSGA